MTLTLFLGRRVADLALAQGIPSALLPAAAAAFRRTLLSRAPRSVAAAALPSGGDAAALQQACERLFPLFAAFAASRYPAELAGAAPLLAAADWSAALPGRAFPLARALRRRLVYHAGPTNSGKTHAALEALRSAESGVYCGPLRLLAMEVYDSCNASGVYCSLRTGQERRDVPFARHVSCTVEMADVGVAYDVAVLDEIQLLADEHRGWAWTRALYGLPARELHLCGDGSALPLVRAAAAALGEELTVREYTRLTPLEVAPRSLDGDYANVRPGDAIVAFSRRAIFDIKRAVELRTGRRCAVVYGALPPEARRRQAALFNDAERSGHDVLVASDAVGLGLNLNIRRVVFHALQRREGRGAAQPPVPLPAPLVRQIAGRAGRAGSRWPSGEVAAFYPGDVARLRECLAAPTTSATAAGVLPSWEHIEPFAEAFPGEDLPALLSRYDGAARLGGGFFMCRRDDVAAAATALQAVPGLSLRERFLFATAPAGKGDGDALLRFAAAYAAGGAVPLPADVSAEEEEEAAAAQRARRRPHERLRPPPPDKLARLEARHSALSLYLWLAQRLEADAFPHAAAAQEQAAAVIADLDRGLHDASDAALKAHERARRLEGDGLREGRG